MTTRDKKLPADGRQTLIEELRQRELTARGLLDASTDAILLIDTVGTLLEVNKILADRLGATVQELKGSNIFERLPPKAAERRREWLAEVLDTRETLRREDERDGRILENIVHPLLDDAGEVTSLAIYSQDVTESRMAEAAVYESEHRYRALIDAIPYGIQENDVDGIITLSNAAHARILGCDEGELIGKRIWEMVPTAKRREQLRRYLEFLVREQPPPTPFETPNQTKDGREIEVQVAWTYTRDVYGRLTGFISVITDITEKKRLEKQRAQFVEAIIAAQEEERSRIARELHDETGQALSAILVHLGALEAQDGAAPTDDVSSELRARVRGLIDEVGRLAHGLHPRALDDLGFREALEQYCADYARTHQTEVDLHVDEGETLDALSKATKIAMFRIAQELLTNVAKHAAAERVSVLVERSETGVRMIIEDDGEGFGGEAGDGPRPSHEGLGIAGIRERLALLGGLLTIESTPERGSSIFVDIPSRDP